MRQRKIQRMIRSIASEQEAVLHKERERVDAELRVLDSPRVLALPNCGAGGGKIYDDIS